MAGTGREGAWVQRIPWKSSLAEGPQIVTKRGVAAAVLVPIDQWRLG